MNDQENLREIHRLLDEAYRHYFENSDGHCKSSEGHISVEYGNYWSRQGLTDPLEISGVEIYSYVLGPSRGHRFNTTAEALEAVRGWHEDEMAFDYAASEAEWAAAWVESGE